MSAVADVTEADLIARIEELEELLDRERARRVGLERGVESLSARCEELRRENAELLRRTVGL